jgi:hypothetical protein
MDHQTDIIVHMEGRPFKFPQHQMLRQKRDRDCSVPVFSALTGISEDEICRELPLAPEQGVTVDGWMDWLTAKGLEPLKRQGCPDDIVPCVHLVGPLYPQARTHFHWVYRDAEGDVHDPHPSVAAMPADDPRMRDLSIYGTKVLTISISSQK